MRVTFHKLTAQRLSYWEALRGKRTKVPGSRMALGRGDMPHDLKQLVVEASTGLENGFWGSVAQGATFRSTGRKRTKPGRAVIARNRDGLTRAEEVTGHHVRAWLEGRQTVVTEKLTRFDRMWSELPAEGQITIEWPSLRVIDPD